MSRLPSGFVGHVGTVPKTGSWMPQSERRRIMSWRCASPAEDTTGRAGGGGVALGVGARGVAGTDGCPAVGATTELVLAGELGAAGELEAAGGLGAAAGLGPAGAGAAGAAAILF